MKFPVFTAFGASISYVAAHFLTLIRIAWLPGLLMMGTMAYLMPSIMEAQLNVVAMEEAGQTDPSAVFAMLGESFKAMGLIYLAMAVFYPMMIAGVLRHVLRGDVPGLPFYLWFGGDELRVLITYILFIVMAGLAAIAAFLGVFVIGLFASMVSSEAAGLAMAVLMIALVIAVIWFLLRMSMIFPATVDRRSIGIADSWNATAGRVWGILFYWIFWGIIFMVLGGIYTMVVAGEMFSLLAEAFAAGASGNEAAAQEVEQRILDVQASMYDPENPRFWTYMGVTYLYTVISVAVSMAASGVAWRYVTGTERG